HMPEISGLGHVGLFCTDLLKMRDFYARVLGLTISDENLERGICFLSAAPDAEHHELALVQAKEPGQKTHNVQQVSFKVKRLDDVRGFYHRLQNEGMKIDRTVTHGIACSVHFVDPEERAVIETGNATASGAGANDRRAEIDLARRARRGDTAAFDALVLRFQRPVLRFCWQLLRSTDAEDLAQDTFVRAFVHFERFDP